MSNVLTLARVSYKSWFTTLSDHGWTSLMCRDCKWYVWLRNPKRRRFAAYWHIRKCHPSFLEELFPDGEP